MWETLMTAGLAPNMVRAAEQRRLTRYSLVVDRLAERLDDEERATLRTSRQVPEWFLPAVYAQYRKRGSP
jgi:hypothetical protein